MGDRLKLPTMAQAFRDLLAEPPGNQRSFTGKIAAMVDREWTDRDNRRLARLLHAAHLTINDAMASSWASACAWRIASLRQGWRATAQPA